MAIIEVHGLVKRYGDHTAAGGVGFAVEQGEIFGHVTEVAAPQPQPARAESTGRAAL